MIDESLIDVIIHPSGVITEFKPPYTLEQLQEQVGGYIQSVPLYDDIIMIVNEEGKLQNLLPNLRASMVFRMVTKVRDIICGKAIITRKKNI